MMVVVVVVVVMMMMMRNSNDDVNNGQCYHMDLLCGDGTMTETSFCDVSTQFLPCKVDKSDSLVCSTPHRCCASSAAQCFVPSISHHGTTLA